MSEHKSTTAQAQDHKTGSVSRRTFLRAGGTAAGAVAVGYPAMQSDRLSPVGQSEAAPPILIPLAIGAGGAIGGYALGYAVQSLDSGISNKEAIDALRNDARKDISAARNSISNEYGLISDTSKFTADGLFVEGQLAALPAINQQKPRSEIKQIAKDAAAENFAALQESMVNANNSIVDTISNYRQSAIDTNGVAVSDIFSEVDSSNTLSSMSFNSGTITLVDGTDVTAKYVTVDFNGTVIDKVLIDAIPQNNIIGVYGNETYDLYLAGEKWVETDFGGNNRLNSAYNSLMSEWSTLKSDLETWVDAAVDADMHNEDINAEDLLNPLAIARSVAQENPNRRALANLIASGLGPDEVESAGLDPSTTQISWDHPHGTFKATALLGSTAESETVSANSTLDPGAVSHTYLTSYDLESARIVLDSSKYADGIDGGIISLNIPPESELSDRLGRGPGFVVKTNSGEQATIYPYDSDFMSEHEVSPSDTSFGTGIDISNQLQDDTATITKMTAWSELEGYQTHQPDTPVNVGDIDGDGDENLNFTNDRDIRPTENFLSEEDWNQWRKRNADLLNEAQDSTLDIPGIGAIGDVGSSVKRWVLIGAAAIVGIFALNAASG